MPNPNWYYEEDGYLTRCHAYTIYSINYKPYGKVSAKLKLDRLINGLKGGHFYKTDIDAYLKHNKIRMRKLY